MHPEFWFRPTFRRLNTFGTGLYMLDFSFSLFSENFTSKTIVNLSHNPEINQANKNYSLKSAKSLFAAEDLDPSTVLASIQRVKHLTDLRMADSPTDIQKLPPTTQILSKPRQKPGDFLKKLLNNAILVKLSSGHDFRGNSSFIYK